MAMWAPAPAIGQARQVIAAEQRIPSPGSADLSFALPAVPPGEQVRLSAEARIDWPNLAGNNPWMVVAVNGASITGDALLNKPLEFIMASGQDTTWARGSVWRLVYSPDFSNAARTDPNRGIPDTDPYAFTWNITALVHPGQNSVRFTTLSPLAKSPAVVLRSVTIEMGQPEMPPKAVYAAPANAPAVSYVAASPQTVAMNAALSPSGSIRIAAAGRTLVFTTRTSMPNGGWAQTRQEQWQPLTSGRATEAKWASGAYTVTRRVTVAADHVSVADTISSTASATMGVIIQNRLALDTRPTQVLLAGVPIQVSSRQVSDPTNPSVVACWPGLAVGMVAEDDIFRVHVTESTDSTSLTLSDPQLAIPANGAHTLEWSIYPAPDGDYWAVVNAIRRNWGSNITIPGPMAFWPQTIKGESAAQWVQHRALSIAVTPQAIVDNGDLAEGTAIPLALPWCARMKSYSDQAHAAFPHLRVLCYLHTQITTEPGAQQKYADSRLLDSHGDQVTSAYKYPIYIFLSKLDDSYGKALLGALPTILADTGADGFFCDEMSYATVPWSFGGAWDECTATIDPQSHALLGLKSSVALLQQPWKLAMVRYLRDHDKMLIGNGAPITRTMLQQGIPRFCESTSYSFAAQNHLACPWALANHHVERTDADRIEMARRFLDEGAVYAGYSWTSQPLAFDFTRVFYPFTPTELHSGVLLGKERILTDRSGRFGWPDGAAADVYVFDANGHLAAQPDAHGVVTAGHRLTELILPDGALAVLIRKEPQAR